MTTIKPKAFIQSVLIDEIGSLINDHPYISFIMMGIGIEFLGKCLDTTLQDWNVSGRSKKDFNFANQELPSLQKYLHYETTYNIYGSFRCGLAHAVAPKYVITLSSKGEKAHLV